MNIGILGSGMVGQTLAGKLAALGESVMIGTRNPAKLEDWLESQGNGAVVGSYAETAAHGDILFNATNGAGSLEALEMAGAMNMDGKVLIDVANPLDFSRGMPPTLFTCNDDSLGEQIQRAYPDIKVVKALNTITAALMVEPGQLADGEHHLFICGNDAEAKKQVTELLQSRFGWRHFVDLGDITAARGQEMYLPLWLRMWGSLNTPLFSVRVVH